VIEEGMEVQRWSVADVERLGGAQGAAWGLRSQVASSSDVQEAVREILAAVRERGDQAVLDYTRRFDTAGREPQALIVPSEALEQARAKLSAELHAGLETAIANVAQVAAAGVREELSVALPQGQRIILRELPVGSAAVYVPGGRAPYPSTVIMGTVAARAAGVLDVAICSPPRADGQIDTTILAACSLCGVSRVYCMGGAQAIASLAYGTESVEPVDTIVGPGNLYVQEAKHQLSGVVGTDTFAGPSDLLVIFDERTEPELVALDMLAQAEHGAGTLVGAISTSPSALDALSERLGALAREYDAQPQGAVFVLVEAVDSRQAIALANAFAPEHLELIGDEAEALSPLVRSAGCLFVGTASATAFGDYVAGSNHVLPTAGAARFASGLSPRHFRRSMYEVRIDADAASVLATAGVPIALGEGFPLHALSMRARVSGELEPP
jgi:histidinol dehydrogenase